MSRDDDHDRPDPDAAARDPRADARAPAEAGAPSPRASLGQVARAVFWSFFGVRRGAAHAEDFARIRPMQLVIVGIAAGLLFVLALVAIVRLVLA
ncbi:DUF2970 domain-containing protein [Derxia gummosa]|uniref:DUF2970 domain-containing protein n=1 Tax=Derxia gummosa DSM 723 TaxID=1121388 RepID=A0A8B6X9V7_9BURK|nr:DUF2970 domain-containing protein [Derxia gummosa]